MADLDNDVDQMSRLVDRLLTLARADSEGVALNRQMVDLSPLLTDLVNQMQPNAESLNLELVARIPTKLIADVDSDALTQILVSLLDNAEERRSRAMRR